MKQASKCPICQMVLSIEDNGKSERCLKCMRVYYPISSDFDFNDSEDIETLTSSDDFYEDGPVLLTEIDRTKKPDPFSSEYLIRKLGSHVSVETELLIPE
jgi:hypothetical protein